MRRIAGCSIAALVIAAGLLTLLGFSPLSGSSGPGLASAAAPAQRIGMKVLLISDNTTDTSTADGIAYGDWVNTLKREGMPYTTWNPTTDPIPALSSTAGDGTQVANYEGVVVAGSGTEGLTTAQWTTLQTFEQQFSVRQVTAYVSPSSDYGLSGPGTENLGATSALTLTADGHTVFPYLNSVALDAGSFGYEATPLAGANVDTLIGGPNGSTALGIYTTADGRQTMFQTFNENQYMLQSELLRHGELDWLTRDTYFGDQRNYLTTHIDDNFLSDDSYTVGAGVGGGSTDYNPTDALRESASDVATAAAWSAQNHFRIDMLFNGGGSTGSTDPLLTQFKADKNDFGWINHTWDHPNIDEGCANAAYIESEVTQNNTFAASSLGLTASTDPTQALGNNNPGVVVTGEHSGLANLIPGTPGTVDPPEFNDVTPTTGTTTFAAGVYTYAITDDFTAGGGQSSASETTATLAAGDSVTIDWDAVCHAADYYVYRLDPGATTWNLVATVPAPSDQFGNTGPEQLSATDTNIAPTTTTVPSTTVNAATESPYEQNTNLDAAFGALHIADFGSDASKPYPNPADAVFATGTLPSEVPAGSTFTDAGATAIPRYPTNIYYNVSTEAQEVNEYETLYDEPTCVAIPSVTTCNPAGTAITYPDIVASIDQGMFQHLMGNDPRPDYFHQTNMMGQPPAAGTTSTNPPTVGDGLYYSTMNPLLAQYNQYFAANAPLVQPTMAQIGALLSEQSAWAAAQSAVTGSIQGNAVTVDNTTDAAVLLPLTGTTGGSAYAGTHSYWTSAPSGTSTYTALAAWPAPPTTPVVVTVPTGPAPGGPAPRGTAVKPPAQPGSSPVTPKTISKPAPSKAKPAPAIFYRAVQVKPKTVSVRRGRASVALQCRASRGRTAGNRLCAGTVAVRVSGRTVKVRFRFRSPKTAHVSVALPRRARTALTVRHRGHAGRRLTAKLVITTSQPHARGRVTRGSLTIRG